jgi:hypothetical protein
MAARINKIRHDEETRAKIQAAQIINRFHACLMGDVTLDAQQVSVGKALLAKVLPDLSAVTLENGENPFEVTQRIELVAPQVSE